MVLLRGEINPCPLSGCFEPSQFLSLIVLFTAIRSCCLLIFIVFARNVLNYRLRKSKFAAILTLLLLGKVI